MFKELIVYYKMYTKNMCPHLKSVTSLAHMIKSRQIAKDVYSLMLIMGSVRSDLLNVFTR